MRCSQGRFLERNQRLVQSRDDRQFGTRSSVAIALQQSRIENFVSVKGVGPIHLSVMRTVEVLASGVSRLFLAPELASHRCPERTLNVPPSTRNVFRQLHLETAMELRDPPALSLHHRLIVDVGVGDEDVVHEGGGGVGNRAERSTLNAQR